MVAVQGQQGQLGKALESETQGRCNGDEPTSARAIWAVQ